MEDQVNRLVEKTWAKYQTLPPASRLLIAISGIPGSGKTTLAQTISNRLNSLASSSKTKLSEIATYIPMDGYHFSRTHLSSMPNPAHAHARRGAAFTFDSTSLLTLITTLRAPLTPTTPTIYAPSFSHALKDPVENDIPIPPSSRILIFEGNYLSLKTEPWDRIAGLMDELWFVEVDFEVAGSRLVPRHVKAGIAGNEEEAWKRVRENDLVNGKEIVEGRLEADEIVYSREDNAWKPGGEEAASFGGLRSAEEDCFRSQKSKEVYKDC